MFDEKGQIIVAKEDYEGDADELMMQALDAGAEDFSEEEDSYEIPYSAGRFLRMSAERWRMQVFRWQKLL